MSRRRSGADLQRLQLAQLHCAQLAGQSLAPTPAAIRIAASSSATQQARACGPRGSRVKIFQRDGAPPGPWASYQGENPCGPGFANDVVTLHSFKPFSDFNQAGFGLSKVLNPLVAQEPDLCALRGAGERARIPLDRRQQVVPRQQPAGARDVRALQHRLDRGQGRLARLTDNDTPAIRARYYVVPGAAVFDERWGRCTARDIALVGLHIVTKTRSRPQWIWSSFEHVDNVPGLTREPKPPEGVPFSFYNPSGPQELTPDMPPGTISPSDPPPSDRLPEPMQVVRQARRNLAREHGNERGLLEPAADQGHGLAELHAGVDPVADRAAAGKPG